ncbi:restriction endonuclease subunit S [Aestuariivirga sp.]|uniref:restriction endonuclease subunit S n=1 Tax=Aestuariivirga sp. TaxID=2650926 RepID=UPI0030170E15
MNAPSNNWFGKLKTQWPVVPLRSVAKLGTGHTPSRSVPEYWETCTIPWVTVEDIRREGEWAMTPLMKTEQHISELGLANSAAVLHPAGTVMLSRTASIGLSCITGRPMATTQAFVTWTPNSDVLYGRYLLAALKAMGQQFEYLAYGATHLTIYFPDISLLRVPLPPLGVQKAIATFLDRETAKIDDLIVEQQRLIELLKEKRQAVISHAVTKGLNPDAPMKDSGIEWLGEVPEHWHCASLIRIAERVVVGIAEAATHAYVDDGTPILRSTNIKGGSITGEVLRIDPAFAAARGSKAIRAGDLVTVRTGNAGATAVVSPALDGCQCFTMLVTTLNDGFCPDYYGFWMNSAAAQTYFQLEGWGTAQVNISVPILKALPVPMPPKSEQQDIVNFLRDAIAESDAFSQAAVRAISLLQERRSALISAAVTGDIDVRGLAGSEAA